VDLPDALGLAQHLLDEGTATPALRRALSDDAGRAERVSPDEYFASGTGCVFLDPDSPGAACSVYAVRPHDCRIWFIHGVPDGSWCAPGAPERELVHVTLPELEEADLRFRTHWRARQSPGLAARPVWVPLALGVLAALDLLEDGPRAMTAWRARLDAATQRSFALCLA
jgi:Fe-S-cluster containining protein